MGYLKLEGYRNNRGTDKLQGNRNHGVTEITGLLKLQAYRNNKGTEITGLQKLQKLLGCRNINVKEVGTFNVAASGSLFHVGYQLHT